LHRPIATLPRQATDYPIRVKYLQRFVYEVGKELPIVRRKQCLKRVKQKMFDAPIIVEIDYRYVIENLRYTLTH
jgi:hypothetical protein